MALRLDSLENERVNKLCIGIGVFVGGWIGWALGERWGMFAAYWVSGLGSLLGVYLGWKLARKLEE